MTLGCKLLVAAMMVLGSTVCLAGSLIEFEHFDRDLLRDHGVTPAYSDEGFRALRDLAIRSHEEHSQSVEEIRARLTGLKADAGSRAARAMQDELRTELRLQSVFEHMRQRIARAENGGRRGDKVATYRYERQLLYSLESDVLGARPARRGFTVWIRHVGWLSHFRTTAPYLGPAERQEPLNGRDASREAWNLVDPQTGHEYVDPAELAGMAPEAVAALDVRDDHPYWYTQKRLDEIRREWGTPWRYLEHHIATSIAPDYELDRARRVLVFKLVLDSGTSPKMLATDAWGEVWKILLGEEIQSDPIANRLYVAAGGRYQDLVYANAGGVDELVLVLDEEESIDAADCSRIASFVRLQGCLYSARYRFDVSPYVVEQGTITEANAASVLCNLEAGRRNALFGRRYVVFNESMVELAGGSKMARLGATPWREAGALEDRVLRSLLVFSYWLSNKDAKEDNNRGVYDPGAGEFLAALHDQGASLGGVRPAGLPNRLAVGRDFISRHRKRIVYKGFLIYRPTAWKRATFADVLWMSTRIRRIPEKDIEDAVAASRWPDFVRKVMVERLRSRRNDISRSVDLAEPTPDVEPRRVIVELETRAQRIEVARRYRLDLATGGVEQAVDLLEAEMERAGVEIGPDGLAGGYREDVVRPAGERKSAVAGCADSILVNLLERTVRPTGLSRRLVRGKDDRPLPDCHPQVGRHGGDLRAGLPRVRGFEKEAQR